MLHRTSVLLAGMLLGFGSATAADFGASLGGDPLPAALESAEADIRAVQEDLIWTGDYNGMVDGAMGPNMRRAISQWQARMGLAQTGELSPEEMIQLRIDAGSIRAGFGWTLFRNPELGYEIAYPAALLGQSRPLAYGGREFPGKDSSAGLKVEVAPAMAESDFGSLYDNLAASRDKRQITYSRRGTDWLVVIGETPSQGFYTRVIRRTGAIAGYTFTWPNSDRGRFEPAVIAMASSFNVPEYLEPGPREPLDPRHEATSPPAATRIPGSRRNQGLPPMPGPPLRDPLDARGVFRAVSKAVWVALAARTTPHGIDEEHISLGSAVAISRRHLLTNCHTLEGSDVIAIFQTADDPDPVSVEPVFLDSQNDRCVLVSPMDLPQSIVIRPIEDLEVGERVYTVGAPSGLDLTLGDGLISSLRDKDGIRYIQTTAPISSGSSGGGLFDSRGNLIGITTFLIQDAQNLNFALAASDFWRATEQTRGDTRHAETEQVAQEAYEGSGRENRNHDPFALHDDDPLALMPLQMVLTETLPEKNFVDDDDYFGLLFELLNLEVDTVGEVRQLISELLPYALAAESDAILDRLSDPSTSDEEKRRLRVIGTYCTHVCLVRTMLIKKFGSSYRVFDPKAMQDTNDEPDLGSWSHCVCCHSMCRSPVSMRTGACDPIRRAKEKA